MFFISKNDKKIWEEYIINFEKLKLNIDIRKKEKHLKISKKDLIQKSDTINSYKLFKKGKTKPDGIIDLHGYRLKIGKIKLENYILNSYENNLRNILIITGKGLNNLGALKREVPIWLENQNIKKFLISYETAPYNFGGSGALLVRIKNKYKI
ncbi:Smr/MutS family protein [Alphaproteobacteria bacterium]|nr:Smr/MutS family protein [Alphaproteobacteria bacterium]